ncbi:DUF4912 domain-containing protein [Kovacikia minuta CCNUW1]|uniref:DUF4912 domain-containing protein n=1 Tax=Kovacikia minuta TaxID=2931930 RepID=UPI001CCE3BF2|nr:DUF4912 domain-containing protein [Kovacikia minuta]UBF26353.1 DUF4912 domain-containing protein [Kovacikia minuta CCNUW1]
MIKGGGAALAGAAGATAVGKALSGDRAASEPLPLAETGRIILVPRTAEDAYAYWEVPESAKETLRHQGGEKLALRLYDVTGGVDLARQAAHNVQQYSVDELDQDRHLPISVSDRDYVAELGYIAEGDRWLTLARSKPVRVPAQFKSANG